MMINDKIVKQYKEKITKYNGAVEDKQVKFAETLTNMVLDKNKTDKVEVVIARCGMGKSVIVNTILDNLVNRAGFGEAKDKFTGKGAILITDSLERLEGVNKQLKNFCYLMKNDLDIPEIENRMNFQQKIKEQFKYPILLITTQRYFSMSKEERDFMYTWSKGERNIAFIDEKPILTNEIIVDEKFLSEIKIALHECYEGKEKQYLLDTFTKIYNDLDYIRRFSKISIRGICNKKNIQRTNLIQGKGRYKENAKIVREEIESEIAKLYIKNEGEENGESKNNSL